MATLFDRDDWRSALTRWREADLIDEATESAVLQWETERSTAPRNAAGRRISHGRVADVAAYLGASIVVIAWLLLTVSLFDDGLGSFAFSFAGGIIGVAMAWLAERNRSPALADACSGVSVLLIAIAVGWLLDEIGDDDQLWLGWFLITLVVVSMGILMLRLTRSALATFAASAALAQSPAALAIGAGALDHGVFGS